MARPDLAARLDQAEQDVADEVRQVLDEVAAEISRELATAMEIVAARFSLSAIGRMWRARMPRLVRRLLGVAEQAAQQAATDSGQTLPDGWTDLPERHDQGDELPASLGSYVTDTEHLLRAVGDRLTAAAVAELAAGLDAGEDIPALRARLREAFSREGAELGEMREERIARTEATRAWNAATLAAGQALTAPDRPLVKQWVTRHDARVRHAHNDVDGALRLVDEAFTVGGLPMRYPGDPLAPAALTVNCRCVLRLAPEQRTASVGVKDRPRPSVSESKADRVRRQIGDRMGLPASLLVGPADRRPAPTLTAAATTHTGAMIALIPAEEDAQRLALEDGELADELHCTLMFLGDADDWSSEQRVSLAESVTDYAQTAPIAAHVFGAAHWNPHGDEPVWVWSVGDDRDNRDPDALTLQDMRYAAAYAVFDALEPLPEIPDQHSSWHPHVTAIYSADTDRFADLIDRVGPIRFDRLRVAFAGEHVDIPLALAQEEPMADSIQAEAVEPAPPPVRTWTTPDDSALAYEGRRTGDGRIFAEGALRWDTGPWPLNYADRLGQAHEGARLAGAIAELGRDGDRLTGRGPMYPTTEAGWEVCSLLDQQPPAALGVSVDLDDVSIQVVDNTATDGDDEDEPLMLAASFASASIIRLDDGAWQITAQTRPEVTASGVELTHSTRTISVFTSSGGAISRATARQVFGAQLTAAADDPDPEDGVVVHEETAGDYLLRITDARVRGATLVSIPAFADARIVLDPPEQMASAPAVAAASGDEHDQVVAYVCSSPTPVTAREVSEALGLDPAAVHSHFARALEAGRIVRIARGQYVGASTLPEGDIAASSELTDEQRAAVEALDARYEQHGAQLVASALRVVQAREPFPAAWFREPTEEELPPDSGGVHVVDGRAYGWVAQAGVPHELHGRKVTIEKLAKRGIDTSYFLRTKLQLDDGSTVAVGPMTMNVGHHRDGFECETDVCQFDDSRTVGAVVTVGINERGMWFSGAAGEWLSAWDSLVYRACQPSYHMTQARDGSWQLKAVLSVPSPGHPSRLAASAQQPGLEQVAAVIDRSNIAITAAAAALEEPATADTGPEPVHERTVESPATDVGALATVLADPDALDGLAAALERRLSERAAARAEAEQLATLLDEPTTATTGGN
ncbi:hypothetical protein AQJ30_15470 [Streptomyces longwoodensis]|uniref:Phage head morphogenesis domain-containing protein n=1 Tax=Streptomyces longwoodensis TaxID=68231 RepID=A0A101QXC2_9ACTN|nr:phage minor head protein [Streptomyces longwoodensis]KUN37682.1 hypothetical protein AQJ30_15470 [Streptomyces longwoodensis]